MCNKLPILGPLALVLTPLCVPQAQAALIAHHDFAMSSGLLSFTTSPDLRASQGFFPTDNRFDLFGVTDRQAAVGRNSTRLVDGTGDGAAGGSGGLLPSSKTDPLFVVDDLTNSDNPDGDASAAWLFDIRGASDLELAIDLAGRGDFERSDHYVFHYGIDSGPLQPLFDIAVDESASQIYHYEDGSWEQLADPLLLDGQDLLGVALTTHVQAVDGTGDVLRLHFAATGNGNDEIFAFDNIRITGQARGVPTPPPALLIGAGLCGMLGATFRPGKR